MSRPRRIGHRLSTTSNDILRLSIHDVSSSFRSCILAPCESPEELSPKSPPEEPCLESVTWFTHILIIITGSHDYQWGGNNNGRISQLSLYDPVNRDDVTGQDEPQRYNVHYTQRLREKNHIKFPSLPITVWSPWTHHFIPGVRGLGIGHDGFPFSFLKL